MPTKKTKTEEVVEETVEEVVKNTVVSEAEEDMEELVDFYRAPLPFENAGQQINLTLNGQTVSYLRGNHVKIARKFVKLVEQGEKEQYEAMQKRMQLQNEGERAINNMLR